MKSIELENIFINYFKKNCYHIINEAHLIPKKDQTLLFTNSGMVQFKNIFLGFENIKYDKIVTSQTCLRLGGKHDDLNNIGKSKHHNTSFKMLGNFEFNNVKKEQTIYLAWHFLTKILKINKNKLYISIHKKDITTANYWKNITNIKYNQIILGNDNTNFWNMDTNGPCGYCTEIFYKLNDNKLLELWNLVFIQFNKKNNKLAHLNKTYIDTGMGLERITSVIQKTYDNFKTDIYAPLIKILSFLFKSHTNDESIHIITDHLKTISLLITNNIIPGNEKHGYILKKLIRKTIIEKKKLTHHTTLHDIPNDFYLELGIKNNTIILIKKILKQEESKFNKTIIFGQKFLTNIIQQKKPITGKLLFKLYDTYGLPMFSITDIIKKYNINIDMTSFNDEMTNQINKNKKFKNTTDLNQTIIKNIPKTIFVGYSTLKTKTIILTIIKNNNSINTLLLNETGIIITQATPFYPEKGGQVSDIGWIKKNNTLINILDVKKYNNIYLHYCHVITGKITINDTIISTINKSYRKHLTYNHSATHLLHTILKNNLGKHVKQMGSLIKHDYFRFDFTHFTPLSKHDIITIENNLNNYIQMNLSIKTYIHNDIRTVCIGNISIEHCAGTHVNNTNEIGLFKILKEYGIGTSIRRIEAITGIAIITYLKQTDILLSHITHELKTNKQNIIINIKKIITKNKLLHIQNTDLFLKYIHTIITNNITSHITIDNIKIINIFENIEYIKHIQHFVKNNNNLIMLMYCKKNNTICITVSKNLINITAKKIITLLKNKFEINGGGGKHFATGIIKIYNNSNITELSTQILLYLNTHFNKIKEDIKC